MLDYRNFFLVFPYNDLLLSPLRLPVPPSGHRRQSGAATKVRGCGQTRKKRDAETTRNKPLGGLAVGGLHIVGAHQGAYVFGCGFKPCDIGTAQDDAGTEFVFSIEGVRPDIDIGVKPLKARQVGGDGAFR